MKTLFVSGSDTNVGKTWVLGAIAQFLSSRGDSVQVVKPIESGVSDPSESDAGQVLRRCDNPLVTGHTLWSLSLPIAPVAAAEREGLELSFSEIASAVADLPDNPGWRMVEGAGSLATPITKDGKDWADLALELEAQAVILVVEDRVGAIGQARMVYEYAKSRHLVCGIWLNEIRPQDALGRRGTLEGIQNLKIPIWGFSNAGQLSIDSIKGDWL